MVVVVAVEDLGAVAVVVGDRLCSTGYNGGGGIDGVSVVQVIGMMGD